MDKIIKFIGHYADELYSIITILNKLVDSSSILRDDRLGLQNIINELAENAESIKKALANNEIPTVVIKASDIDNAVKTYLAAFEEQQKSYIDKQIAEAVANAKAETIVGGIINETNSNAGNSSQS